MSAPSSGRRRVVVTGLGAVTPLGHDVRTTWEGLLAGRSGAGPITLFDTERFAVRFACEVHDWDPAKHFDVKKARELDRFAQLALVAAGEAMADSSPGLTDHERTRAGCILGTSMGGLATIESTVHKIRDKGPERVSPYAIPAAAGNLGAGQISIRHGLCGPSFSAASACATAAHSIGEAAEWIRRGRVDLMIAGGADALVTPLGIAGFQAMRALSKRNDDPARASRPFDLDRDGFVCGEGAGVLVLESLERAVARGARIYAELTGYGASSDAFHICVPPESGEGCARSMAMALEDAGLPPDAIGYVNVHATSTPLGDLAEANGIRTVFGAHATDRRLLVSATKSMIGHTLGAAGGVGSIASVLAMVHGVVTPTINVERPDPGIGLDVVPNEARPARPRHVLVNAFGFGGANASLVFSALDG